jgi:type VI protein secretion system component VasF
VSEHEIPVHADHGKQNVEESSATRTGHKRANHKSNTKTGTPWWVIGFVLAFVIVVLMLVIMHLTGNGFANHMGMVRSILENGV